MHLREVSGNANLHGVLSRLHRRVLPLDDLPDFSFGWWWLATCRGDPVAFAGMVPVKSWNATMYLKRAGVIPEFRGRGLQRRLIHARCAKARRLGAERVITDTTDNPASSNNLIACGFRMYTPTSPWAYSNTCYWIKTL